MTARILAGDALERLRELPSGSVHCIVTSPAYWGLRKYQAGAQEMGSEATPQEHIERLVAVFHELRRVLRDDGTCWLNYGDSYTGGGRGQAHQQGKKQLTSKGTASLEPAPDSGLEPLNLVGLPERLVLALQADGWVWRSTVAWCLSGGTWVYARTQKGDMPMMLRDLARLKPETVQLWNGKRWTRILGISRIPRQSTEIEILLRSGERISATPTHCFPTGRGLLPVSEIVVGDKLEQVRLPEPEQPRDSVHIGLDAAWLAGLYLAEGSRLEDKGLSIAGHISETTRYDRVKAIAESYGGTATWNTHGNGCTIRVYGKVVVAVVLSLLTGHDALDKGVNPICWRYSDAFLKSLLIGYLSGDGSWEEKNNRWRLGFCRNYNLERDLRTLCSRLGLRLVLKIANATYQGGTKPSFRGEVRFEQSDHWNKKDVCEVMEIRKARARNLYDVGVEDEPHLFALASGILTHNSKPAPMPESVQSTRWEQHQVKVGRRDGIRKQDTSPGPFTAQSGGTGPEPLWAPCPGCPACAANDGLVLRRGSWRPTRAWEPIFMLMKGGQYYGDGEAVREPNLEPWRSNGKRDVHRHHEENGLVVGRAQAKGGFNDQLERHGRNYNPLGHNPRNVWVLPPEPCNWDFCLACGTWYGKGGWQRKSIRRWSTRELDVETEEYRTVPHRRCAQCKAVDEFVDHYAAFPSELPRRCIAASTSEKGVCARCGAPWARVVERESGFTGNRRNDGEDRKGTSAGTGWKDGAALEAAGRFSTTLGWRATCACPPAEPIPATVLDPFMGTATTLLAADRLGRDAIGIDLSSRYVALAEARLASDAPLLGMALAGPVVKVKL